MKKLAICFLFILVTACGRSIEPPLEAYPEPYPETIETPAQVPYVYQPEEPEEIPQTQTITLDLDYAIAIANERRAIPHVQDLDRINEMVYGRTPSIIDWDRLFHPIPRPQALSREEAIDDVKIFFQVLQHAYGPYRRFGGDEVFRPLMYSIIEELSESETVATGLLAWMIQGEIAPIIADNHFVFNDRPQNVSSFDFVWDSPFGRDETGFRQLDTGLYVTEIVGHDKHDVFRLSVNEHGEFFYMLVIFRPSEDGTLYRLEVVFCNGETEVLVLRRSFHHFQPDYDAEPTLRFENEIPIVTMRGEMPFPVDTVWTDYSGSIPDNAVLFLSFVDEIRDEPIIIVDIRTNIGGFGHLGTLWLYDLIGEIVPLRLCVVHGAGAIPPEDMSQLPQVWYDFFNPQEEAVQFFADLDEFLPSWHVLDDYHSVFSSESGSVANDTFIILLVDRFVYSAAEMFTSQILNMENTLVIGQNTFGSNIASMWPSLYLPNSGIQFNMGTNYVMRPYGTWQDGVGYAPDVWVVGDALTAALAIVQLTKD